MAREALCADVIDGWPIPAGALVILSPYINQRQPARWEEPERFDPGRFNPEAVRARPHFAYYPFGGGQRQCLGKNFALVEAAMILPSFIQRYHLRPLDADGPTWRAPLPDITMRPQTPILLMLEKRQPASSTGGRGG
jgi:cytochrome P450